MTNKIRVSSHIMLLAYYVFNGSIICLCQDDETDEAIKARAEETSLLRKLGVHVDPQYEEDRRSRSPARSSGASEGKVMSEVKPQQRNMDEVNILMKTQLLSSDFLF